VIQRLWYLLVRNLDGPLMLLAIPSVLIGAFAIGPMLAGDFFKDVLFVNLQAHPAMEAVIHHAHNAVAMGLHAFVTLPFWLALSGVALSAYFYLKRPDIPAAIKTRVQPIYTLLENKYYMDHLYIQGFAAFGRGLGKVLWKVGDTVIIDGIVVNGTAKLVGAVAGLVRRVQTGYIYHYAFAMIIGALLLLTWWLGRFVIPH